MILEAWPMKSGEYTLTGEATYRNRGKIKAAGGRWNVTKGRWIVTRDMAIAAGATVMVRVIRGPVCCEHAMGVTQDRAVATEAEVERGEVKVIFCHHCDSRTNLTAKILRLDT